MRTLSLWLTLALVMTAAFTILAIPDGSEQDAGPTVPEVQGLLPLDAFYDPPAQLAGEPGALLRSDSLENRLLPKGSRAWRIQYVTTMPDASLAAAVATVLAPATLAAAPMPVIAWDHGTVGLVQRCLPSLTTFPFAAIPAVEQVVAENWVVVAPDFQPNVDGIHPYLIGEGEARSTLDAVRAARQLPDLSLAPQTVVWGHSQGGHAALWTTILAPNYAPDVEITGTVAIAPAADLVTLLEMHGGDAIVSPIGAYLANAYSTFYPDVSYDEAVPKEAREIGRELARRCPFDPQDAQVLGALIEQLGGESLLVIPPTKALASRLGENIPVGPFTTPVVIAQGLDDNIVFPAATDAWVAARCAAGVTLEYWRLPGQDHSSIVMSDSPLATSLISWSKARFANEPPVDACVETALMN